jgi:hypothetical protein
MTAIKRIELRIKTGNRQDAGMENGEVYLGLAGREFHVDSDANDFERGSDGTYIFDDGTEAKAIINGTRAKITDPKENDPTDPWQLVSDDISRCPRYIRFEPRHPGGKWEEWNVASVHLTVKFGNSSLTAERLDGGENLWMGGEYKSRYLYFSDMR